MNDEQLLRGGSARALHRIFANGCRFQQRHKRVEARKGNVSVAVSGGALLSNEVATGSAEFRLLMHGDQPRAEGGWTRSLRCNRVSYSSSTDESYPCRREA